MRALPDIIWRAPRLFYTVAILAFGVSLILGFVEMGSQLGAVDTSIPEMQAIIWAARGRTVYGALYDAAIFAAIGVVCHILLAIYQALIAQGSRGE
ncbi:MAG TPA: hypothetical protein VNX29_00505 [Kaistia sp.]|nr:hypothetical protein [Kaistia sp.]